MTSYPNFIYGTAWKEERTESLTLLALQSGFRAIDTANQRKHYFEQGVGNGLQKFLDGGASRSDLFIQSKFTYVRGQDHRLPYERSATVSEQVLQSLTSSLEHLKVSHLDSYILHGPEYTEGISDSDWKVWETMEALFESKRVNAIGVSNISATQLHMLCKNAHVKPHFVQNRCFAVMGWDLRVREVCKEVGAQYQGFSLLTANAQVFETVLLRQLSAKYNATLAQLVFRFSQQIGMIPLTGTSNSDHMKSDLQCNKFDLEEDEIAAIEAIAVVE